MKGTFEVPVVHCTYLIKADCIKDLTYVDGSNDWEFVIFSRSARNNQIPQYICNKREFGVLIHNYDPPITLNQEKNQFKHFLELQQRLSLLDFTE